MQKTTSSCAAFVVVLVALAMATGAEAQTNVSWVSDAGQNTNDCITAASPCRTLHGATGALAKTVAGGIIHVLPGHYTGFTIDKSIEIIADQGMASIMTGLEVDGSFAAGINVDTAPTDIVRVRGLEVAPNSSTIPPAGGIGGIMLQSAGALHVENCTFVRGDAGFGIVFAPSGAGELYVSGSHLSDNGPSAGGGILIRPTGSGSARATIENVSVENNNGGVQVDGRTTSGALNVTIRNSAISGSTGFGLYAPDAGGGATNVMIENSTISNNGTQGVVAESSNTTVRMSGTTITGNATGIVAAAGAKVISHGGNILAGNTTNGSFTGTFAQQ